MQFRTLREYTQIKVTSHLCEYSQIYLTLINSINTKIVKFDEKTSKYRLKSSTLHSVFLNNQFESILIFIMTQYITPFRSSSSSGSATRSALCRRSSRPHATCLFRMYQISQTITVLCFYNIIISTILFIFKHNWRNALPRPNHHF